MTVLVDGAAHLALVGGVRTLDDWLPGPLRAPAARFGFLRGLLLFVASVSHDTVAVVRTGPGWRSLLVLRALVGRRRKLVALHFLVHPEPDGRFRRALHRAWQPVDRAATRRAVRAGQVLTPWERDEYAERYRVERERFRLIPWPRRRFPARELPPPPAEPLVVASGRAHCDWPTLFAAARDAAWPLCVVCSARDLAVVRELADGNVELRSEIPADEHARLLARATVLVAPMHERGVSQGQVRLMDAADAGVPVVITDARGLHGYVEPGRTAVLVPPGDPVALRDAVDRLLADAAERERIRRAAWERSLAWTADDYLAALADLVHGREHVI